MFRIEKPHSVDYRRQDRTSLLHYYNQPSQRFYMRGGIYWPTPVGSGVTKKVSGFGVMIGHDIATGIDYVMEEFPFSTIESIEHPDGTMKHGAAYYFARLMKLYAADTYFFNDGRETHKKYLYQVIRSKRLKEKAPYFIEVPGKIEQAEQVLYERKQNGKIKFKAGSLIIPSIKQMTNPEVKPGAEILALITALHGLDRYPFKAKYKEYTGNIHFDTIFNESFNN